MMQDQSSPAATQSDVTEIVEALGDSYVLAILDATAAMPLSAREIAREADVPSTTLYRRLDRLVEVGLVEETMRLDGDGDHYHVYRATLERLRLGRGEDGLEIDVEIDYETDTDDSPAMPADSDPDTVEKLA